MEYIVLEESHGLEDWGKIGFKSVQFIQMKIIKNVDVSLWTQHNFKRYYKQYFHGMCLDLGKPYSPKLLKTKCNSILAVVCCLKWSYLVIHKWGHSWEFGPVANQQLKLNTLFPFSKAWLFEGV